MEFRERPNDTEHSCEMKFTDREAEVLRAVYLELINNDAEKGNTTVSEFDWSMCEYGEGVDPSWKIFAGHHGLIEKLDNFHDRTDDAISEIAQEAPLPAYTNWHTHQRKILGSRACELARDIESKAPDLGQIKIPKPEEIPEHFPEDWANS